MESALSTKGINITGHGWKLLGKNRIFQLDNSDVTSNVEQSQEKHDCTLDILTKSCLTLLFLMTPFLGSHLFLIGINPPWLVLQNKLNSFIFKKVSTGKEESHAFYDNLERERTPDLNTSEIQLL